MKQAEDTILGNYLLSAASQYNCQKGVNGDSPTELTLRDFANVNAALDKHCVEYKSWVIDLEARWGDKAQAKAA
jgi:hypothetical protein